jgi:hypothetical protein
MFSGILFQYQTHRTLDKNGSAPVFAHRRLLRFRLPGKDIDVPELFLHPDANTHKSGYSHSRPV